MILLCFSKTSSDGWTDGLGERPTEAMDANARFEFALAQPAPAPARQRGKQVSLRAGGSEWRAGVRPTPPPAVDKFDDNAVVSRSAMMTGSDRSQCHGTLTFRWLERHDRLASRDAGGAN